MLTTSLYGARHEDVIVCAAADILCQNLRQKLLGRRPSNHYFRQATDLGAGIADGEFRSIAGVEVGEILIGYEP